MTERKWNVDENFNVWEIQPTRETTISSSMIKEDLEKVTANGLSVMEEMGIKITPKKRFNIVKSKLIEKAHVVEDEKKQFTFPTLVGDKRGLIAYEKALNKLSEENEQLQERNDRQRKRLDNLYQLILNRDYTGQEELIKELEECEQLLQEENKLYCR